MTQDQRDAAARAAESEVISVHQPDNKEAEEEAKKFDKADVDYIFEPGPLKKSSRTCFRATSPRRSFTRRIESVAAMEQDARMTATDSATKNAADVDRLSLADQEPRPSGSFHQEITEL